MSTSKKRQLSKGLTLLSGLWLLASCAEPPPPYAVVDEPETATVQQNTVQAQIQPEAPRETIIYEPEYPQTYIVQKGDTLWDISSMFLQDPWYWPEIWFKNPQVENPHLIYPGDTLAIVYIGGERRVQVLRRGEDGAILSQGGSSGLTVVKLNPRVRAQSIDAAIPTIPIGAIRQLLERPRVINQEQLDTAAYVLASQDNNLAYALDERLYVRKLDTSSGSGRYQVFRPNRPIFDPDTEELLGYEAIYVGESKLVKRGDPATVVITQNEREILRDDRVLPIEQTDFDRDFFPKPPATDVKGRVVGLYNAISQIGPLQTVAVNLGYRDGLEVGNLLAVKQVGEIVPDNHEEDPQFTVKLPDERVGLAMIVRTFEKMSYALVLEANRPINTDSLVESP